MPKYDVVGFITLPAASVMQVATAHGSDMSSLLRNPELAVLLGGIETVTLGDARAAKDNLNRKTRQERNGPPVFDALIEVLGQVHGGTAGGGPISAAEGGPTSAARGGPVSAAEGGPMHFIHSCAWQEN